MIAISFTGVSRRLSNEERLFVQKTIANIKGYPDAFFSGMAPGVDVAAAEFAMQTFPEAKHICLIPTWQKTNGSRVLKCKHHVESVKYLKLVAKEVGANLTLRKADAGVGSEAKGLLRRNDILAVNCTHMMAFPETKKEHTRSGTWATVRRARKLNRKVLIKPLS
jgi:predicted Rossmann fold nucleotide-binding protein DprA/Smf involved in DNA uptake